MQLPLLGPTWVKDQFKSEFQIWCAILECMWTPLECRSLDSLALDVLTLEGFSFAILFSSLLDLNLSHPSWHVSKICWRVVMTPHRLMARKFGTYLQEIKSDFFLAYESGPYHGRPYLRFHAKGRWVHGAFDSSILFRGPRFLKFLTKIKAKIKE